MKRLHPVVLAATALLTLAGCASGGPPGTSPEGLDGNWTLTSAADAAGPVQLDGAVVTLNFDETTGGRAACNGYTAKVRGGPGELSVTQITQTEMACVPASLMEVESRYLSALGEADAAEYDGDDLVITGPDVELRFAPGSPSVTGTFDPADPDSPVMGCDDGAKRSPDNVCPQ